jgi:hypothetical protein
MKSHGRRRGRRSNHRRWARCDRRARIGSRDRSARRPQRRTSLLLEAPNFRTVALRQRVLRMLSKKGMRRPWGCDCWRGCRWSYLSHHDARSGVIKSEFPAERICQGMRGTGSDAASPASSSTHPPAHAWQLAAQHLHLRRGPDDHLPTGLHAASQRHRPSCQRPRASRARSLLLLFPAPGARADCRLPSLAACHSPARPGLPCSLTSLSPRRGRRSCRARCAVSLRGLNAERLFLTYSSRDARLGRASVF